MSSSKNIRVCLKCRMYVIVNETPEGKAKVKQFEARHAKHALLTTKYSEIDNLECGKVTCEDDDPRDKLHFVK